MRALVRDYTYIHKKSYSSKTSNAEMEQWKRGKSQHDYHAAKLQLTTQAGEIFWVSVGQQSSKRLLPTVQLTALHNISPVLGHHWGYKLQFGTNSMIIQLSYFSHVLVPHKGQLFKHWLTTEILFFCLFKYFCWVFLRSSSPPLIANRMASG